MPAYAETLRKVMEGDFEDATPAEKNEAVREVIQVCAIAAAAVSVQPVPLLDVALISPIQIGMVQAVGRVHGHTLDRKSILEMLSTFGASLVAQNAMMAAAKFVPILGWAVSISMAYALTFAIGEVSDHYFKHGRGVSQDDLRTMFKKVYKEKRSEREAAARGTGGSLKERLEQLKEAYKEGLITEEQFEQKKAEMLAAL